MEILSVFIEEGRGGTTSVMTRDSNLMKAAAEEALASWGPMHEPKQLKSLTTQKSETTTSRPWLSLSREVWVRWFASNQRQPHLI
jgi:hypothetical protein